VRNTVKGFRLDDDVLLKLKDESREKRITLNNHVNNILAIHNETYSNLQKLHYIWMSPEFISTVVSFVPEKKIKIVGDLFLKDLKKQIRYCHGDIHPYSIMSTIESICVIQDIPFNLKEYVNGEKKYTILHGLGRKWSLIQKYVLENLFAEISNPIKDFYMNCDHVTFTIQNK
jgi:hypothetical protein